MMCVCAMHRNDRFSLLELSVNAVYGGNARSLTHTHAHYAVCKEIEEFFIRDQYVLSWIRAPICALD